MKILVVLIFVTLAATVTSLKYCRSTMDCTERCADGYHEQCNVEKMCVCPGHSCRKDSDCPKADGSGCPSSCTATCMSTTCNCACEK